MNNYGFIRVASAIPEIKVGDCSFNLNEIKSSIDKAIADGCSIIAFPELSITSYTCGDLFHQQLLIEKSLESIDNLTLYLKNKPIVVIVGLPLLVDGVLYNVAAVIANNAIQAFVPKSYIPNYGEFYEKRWFSPSFYLRKNTYSHHDLEIPIGIDIIFKLNNIKFGIEICEDLWAPIPPSSNLTLHGAELIFNLSASNDLVNKTNYKKNLISQQSSRCLAGYIYTSSGVGESTTDTVFSGGSFIYENGSLLNESKRFHRASQLITADIDIERLRSMRIRNTTFADAINFNNLEHQFRIINIPVEIKEIEPLNRVISKTPFIPEEKELLDENCKEIFAIQTTGLAKRLKHTQCKNVVIGISGGLDSTLALLVTVKTYDDLNLPRKDIIGITMPGMGTSNRTYNNAVSLMKMLGVSCKEISINESVIQHFKDIDHDIKNHDITYENAQARERTQVLMDYANKTNAIVIGTGDLSELALGWCTYNGDHMSMYAVNTGIPKTLVFTLVSWISKNEMKDETLNILQDILETPVSPELLPLDNHGNILQATEDIVGPYILHDFFLYYFLRFGFSPSKIYFLAKYTFQNQFEETIILKWLKTFFRRFFSQQFKRSCLPDGPKVGSVNLSPRSDWRMPSDASVSLWMEELNKLK